MALIFDYSVFFILVNKELKKNCIHWTFTIYFENSNLKEFRITYRKSIQKKRLRLFREKMNTMVRLYIYLLFIMRNNPLHNNEIPVIIKLSIFNTLKSTLLVSVKTVVLRQLKLVFWQHLERVSVLSGIRIFTSILKYHGTRWFVFTYKVEVKYPPKQLGMVAVRMRYRFNHLGLIHFAISYFALQNTGCLIIQLWFSPF